MLWTHWEVKMAEDYRLNLRPWCYFSKYEIKIINEVSITKIPTCEGKFPAEILYNIISPKKTKLDIQKVIINITDERKIDLLNL